MVFPYQFSIFSDWQSGPSLVQVHMTHGDTLLACPVSMETSPTLQVTRSFHRERSSEGSAAQDTLGFRKGSGMSKAARWMAETSSPVSQITLERVTLLISASWLSVNLTRGFPVSYQKRSHLRRLRNWMPMMQAKVGPTRPPWRGVSARPPEK